MRFHRLAADIRAHQRLSHRERSCGVSRRLRLEDPIPAEIDARLRVHQQADAQAQSDGRQQHAHDVHALVRHQTARDVSRHAGRPA
jgi:hypothetical protein